VSQLIGKALDLERRARNERDLAMLARLRCADGDAARHEMKADVFESAAAELRAQAETLRLLSGAL
jgi:uncharacterized protein YqfA (UPF0365 family)